MITKTEKPLSFTTKEGKTEYFRNGAEMAGFIAKYRPQYLTDMNKGIDYSTWKEGEFSTAEELKKCYENESHFKTPSTFRKKKVSEVVKEVFADKST